MKCRFELFQRVRAKTSGFEGIVVKIERNTVVPHWANGMVRTPFECLVRSDGGVEVWWYETALEIV